ncbi:MAG: fimbrillin family protein [Bacteroidales bacterium]|nr:fimbrillin family protein [Bacteroidales bacterium]
MKTKLLLGALAVLGLAACSKSEIVEINKSEEISLGAVTGKNITKAADGYCNNSMPNDFDVWAATDGKKYFEAEKYTLVSGTTYKSASARYWPETAVDFFAAKNYGSSATLTETIGATKLDVSGFEVTTTVAAQKDFIYAVNKGVSKPSDGAAATLNFRHALSQIEFQAKNENTKIHVEISGLTIKNVYSKGNFSVADATSNNYVEHNHGETPDSDSRTGRCTWDGQATPVDYSLSFSTAVDLKNGDSADLSVTDPSGKEYNDKTMYLIPQTVANPWGGTGAPASDQAYFLLTAKIYNVAGTEVNKSTDVVLHDGQIAVPIPTGTTWVDGLRYVYTFNFTTYGTGGVDPGTGSPVLTPISLTVTVDDFVDAGNTDVDVK